MRTLSAFMAGAVKPVEHTFYAASSRIVNPETGQPEEWEIKCVASDKYGEIRKSCVKNVPVRGGRKWQYTQELDTQLFQAKMACACTVWPDLLNAELQDSYGVKGEEGLISAMLTPGEFDDYFAQVMEVNGFDSKAELVEEAKN